MACSPRLPLDGGDDGIRSRRELRGSVFRGRNRPPEGCSVPLPLRIHSPLRNFSCFGFHLSSDLFLGGDDGIRTHDPLLAGQVLSQLSYTPVRGYFYVGNSMRSSQRVGIDLSSHTVARIVFSARQSLTSVFGMGTGGPFALKTPTLFQFQASLTLKIEQQKRWA